MLRLFTRFSRKEVLLIVIAVVFIAFGVWLDLLLPEYTGKIGNAITPNTEGIVTGTMSDIWINGMWMLVCVIGSVITVVIVGFIASRISASFSARMRADVFKKVSSFSTQEIKHFSVPSLITRSTNDVNQVRMFVAMGLQMMIKAPITAVWALVKIWGKSQQLSLVTAVAVAAMTVMIVFVIFLVLPKFRKIQTLTDKLNQVARESLTGIRVVRAYNAEDFEQEKFERANDNLLRNNLFANRAFAIVMPFMSLLLSGLGLAIWWMSAILINDGNVTMAGDIMEFQQYSFQIIFAFMMLIMIFVMLPRVVISGRRINEVLNVKPTIIDGGGVHTDTKLEGEVEFKNVGFKYPNAEAHVLENINIKIKKGQNVAFIGSTGSGKSTLVNLLPRLYDATEGEVLLNGINIKEYTMEQLCDKVGYIPQTAVLFKGTVASNITFGTVNGKAIEESEINRALEIAQATEFVNNKDGGINAEVSQGGKNLSGGQKQRLAIARVIARRPQVIIFDDTFSALDYKTDQALRASLKKSCADSTVLIVAQRVGTIMDADQIIVLDQGRIVGQGTHKELMKSCEVYKQIAYSQLSKEELA